MSQSVWRQAREISDLIRQSGDDPSSALETKPQEQYLSHLSLRFLLPKLVEAKQLCVQRYENALAAIEKLASPSVVAVLKKHLAEAQSELAILHRIAAEVSGATPKSPGNTAH